MLPDIGPAVKPPVQNALDGDNEYPYDRRQFSDWATR